MKENKRKRYRKVMAWSLVALGMVCGWAEAEQGDKPQAAPVEELRQDAQIVSGELESGLRYVIRPTKEPEGRGSVRLRVGVGSLYENEQNTGFSHLLEHMVFNGSRNYKRGELIPVMQKLGLGFGGDANAYTGLLETVYMLELPNLEQRTVDTALGIMRDFADGATLEDEAIEKERGIVISELKARDSASMRAHVALLGQLTEGTKLAERLPIGKEEVLRHGSAELLRALYHSHYVPEKMTLVFTGDMNPKEAEEWVRKHFDGMNKLQAPSRPDIGQLCAPRQRVKLISNDEKADLTLYVSVVKPYCAKEDTIRTRAEDLPLRLACSMLERRLRRISHGKDSAFTQVSVEHQDLYETVNLCALALTSRPEQWRAALQSGVQELRRAMTYGFSDDELHEATDALVSNLQQACATWETMPAAAMADRLVAEIGEKKRMTDAREDQRALMPAVQRILKDPDLCRRALAEAFRLDDARLTMVGALPQDATPDALRGEFFDKAMKAPVQQSTQQVHKPFAYETIGMPGSVSKRETDEEIGVTTMTLSNGVRVNLKPVDFRKGCVAVSAAVDGGLLALPGTPGLANMTEAVMNRGGLQEHSYDELEQLMAARQVGLDFSITPTRFIFSGDAAIQDLEMQCKLLAAAILYPGYRDEGERMLRRSLDNEYRALETTPKGVFATESRRAIYGNNPLFTVPKREELEALGAADVQRALAPLLQKNYVEVTLVGDFEIEKILPVLERTFGAMPARRSEPATLSAAKRRVSVNPWGLRRPLPYPTQLDKTLVVRVHAAGNGRDERRNRRLEVLASILRNRLFNGLRATMGESYSPSVLVESHADFEDAALLSAFSFGVQRNQSLVSSAMESICNGIGQGGIGDEEFELAIRPYRAAVQKKLITPAFWERSLIDLQSNPERRALIRDMVKDVQSITAEEIRTLGCEVFGKDCQADLFLVSPKKEKAEDASAPTSPEEVAEPASSEFPPPAAGEYAVLISAATAREAGWKAVAQALLEKYPGSVLCELPELSEAACTQALRKARPRYVAAVLRPEEVTRSVITMLHLSTRKVDDDPYGDCIWGIVTGYEAEDALRIARGRGTIRLSSLLTLAQPDNSRFEQSCCMSEEAGLPIRERNGDSVTTTTHDADTQQGQQTLQDGLQDQFANCLPAPHPQLILSATPSSPFNLEMPMCKGLIFPCGNRFYKVGCQHLLAFASAHQPAMEGNPGALQSLAEAMHFAPIEPDGRERVWIALGPGAMGDAQGSRQSMAITAVSAYGCHQFVGMTLPSWYGATAKNVLHFFMGHTDTTTLAEAVFLSNQLLLAKMLSLDPRLMKVQLQGESSVAQLQSDLSASGVRVDSEQVRDVAGMVLERDALVFYGDPARPAVVSSARQHAPLQVVHTSVPTLRAEQDFAGPAAVFFRMSQDRPASPTVERDGVRTESFLLYPYLELKAGEDIEAS